jgi:hypothetical protein
MLPPFNVADVPPLDVQLSVELCPLFTVEGDAVNELIAGGLPALTAGLNNAIKQRYGPELPNAALCPDPLPPTMISCSDQSCE